MAFRVDDRIGTVRSDFVTTVLGGGESVEHGTRRQHQTTECRCRASDLVRTNLQDADSPFLLSALNRSWLTGTDGACLCAPP